VFGCQSAAKFELPLYVSRVLLVHGAELVFDAIPDANSGEANKDKNNTKTFCTAVLLSNKRQPPDSKNRAVGG